MNIHELAKQITEVVIQECGSTPEQMDGFEAYLQKSEADPRYPCEWRFMGKLGFGGKVYVIFNPTLEIVTSCYREDKTSEREQMTERANLRFWEIARYFSSKNQESE